MGPLHWHRGYYFHVYPDRLAVAEPEFEKWVKETDFETPEAQLYAKGWTDCLYKVKAQLNAVIGL